MVIIQVKNLKKVFKTHKREPGLGNALKSLVKRKYLVKTALKGISFEINKGEVVGFIGPNGAGKSTTVKALSGVLYPTSGDVNVLGYTPWKDRIKYVRNIGVVFGQKTQLWWDLPAIDSYYLNKQIYRIPSKEFKRRLNYMLKYLDLREVSKKPVRDCSLGERMKCEIVAALLHNPKLVFLDEASIGLDIIAKNLVRDFIIRQNQEQGTTFLITTHDMQEIERLCQRLIIINHGEIIYDGGIEHIKKRYLKKKLVHVKLETKKNNFSFKGVKVIKEKDYEIVLNLDTQISSVKDLVDYLLKNYNVADINISDPPIEEIIEKIYREKKRI
ncbi:MAG: ATP-binding cassette domain-containing protein [Nanoarchaeota archaeon]|nr:ATP-binding cassette domain-containing protein [Nanoarchaeota archaeon]